MLKSISFGLFVKKIPKLFFRIFTAQCYHSYSHYTCSSQKYSTYFGTNEEYTRQTNTHKNNYTLTHIPIKIAVRKIFGNQYMSKSLSIFNFFDTFYRITYELLYYNKS